MDFGIINRGIITAAGVSDLVAGFTKGSAGLPASSGRLPNFKTFSRILVYLLGIENSFADDCSMSPSTLRKKQLL